jgi:Oxidoreductase molybdopterin binding domain
MTLSALDRLLGFLVALVGATGLLTLRAGDPSLAVIYTAHAVTAWALAGAIGVKLARSVPRAVAARRWGRLTLAGAVASLALLSLAGGIAWATGGRLLSIAGWTVLTLHAYAGLALIPLLLVHLVPRRWRLLWPGRWLRWLAGGAGTPRPTGTRLSRRSVLAAGALAAVGVVGWGLGSVMDAVRGSERRFTGSRWLPRDGIPPSTTFFGEGVPTIASGQWRLAVHGRVARPASYTMAELQAIAHSELVAVLDCTSGWAVETTWAGIPTAAVLAAAGPAPDASRVEIRSVTGWGAGLSLAEANRTLLATHVAGEPLPPGNGAPCRLVVPERRGLDWVKWVTEIEVA